MNIADPGELKGLLRRHGLPADKSLGQHFLCSVPVVASIVRAVPEGTRGILEIGPGPGVLTGPLAKRARVIALEVDERFPPVLAESAPSAEVRLIDALQADLGQILAELEEPRAVVSNLPYYITGPLLGKIADAADAWSVAVLMMQREVGEKILAKPGKRERGALSVRIQAEFTVDRVCAVPPGAFMPPPKVESVVLRLVPRTGPVPKDEVPDFRRLVGFGFSQPRKTVMNNLCAGLQLGRDVAEAWLEAAGLDGLVRPHELEEEAWIRLLQTRPRSVPS